ncbi:MAG: hypothetical protein OEY49_15575 [Candidatus Heimdallarchaeota archaeon]|nr:hypothetical protein [Candidatus Heimdallarchaeota archaeon]
MQQVCPHCGKLLVPLPKYNYSFHRWATISYMFVLSIMLILFDLILDGKYELWRFDWSQWAVFGLWILYITAQLLRSNPYFGWLVVPIGGILFTIFFMLLNKFEGSQTGFLGLTWAWSVIIPIQIFMVIFPILGHFARKSPTEEDRLQYMVDVLVKRELNNNE